MYKRVEKHSGKAGLPPGSLVYVGDEAAAESVVRCTALKNEGVINFPLEDFASFNADQETQVIWVDLKGINSAANTGKVMDIFELHALLREDILDTGARPKVELDDDYIFVLGKRFARQEGSTIDAEQMVLMLKGKCVLTMQETAHDSFTAMENRLLLMKEKNRHAGYVFYALLDTLVDSYYSFIENFGDELEELDEELVSTADQDIFNRVRVLKNELLLFRRSLWGMREVLHKLLNEGEKFFPDKMEPYLRDIYENVMQMWETVDMYRDMIGSAIELYLSSASNRLNEVMKILTIISTIFIPVTFIAGLYGMNFKYMPELDWEYGYPSAIAIMVMCVLAMVRYFKNKKWL